MEIKKELLNALEERLKADGDIGQTVMLNAEDLGSSMDVLRAEILEFGPDLMNVLGEFFFMPFEDEGLMFFTSVITYSDSVPREAAADIAAAVARLNYYIPCGCYALGNDDKNLIYRYTAIMLNSEEKERLTQAVISAAYSSVSVAEKYLGYLLLVLKGEITVEEMVKMMLGTNN
ncbi:MAG: hypothetical protein K5770_01530 [Lachnospiraceae bacterium]|nr:hypothetical protein [Lachnospiraceae bacterium]